MKLLILAGDELEVLDWVVCVLVSSGLGKKGLIFGWFRLRRRSGLNLCRLGNDFPWVLRFGVLYFQLGSVFGLWRLVCGLYVAWNQTVVNL